MSTSCKATAKAATRALVVALALAGGPLLVPAGADEGYECGDHDMRNLTERGWESGRAASVDGRPRSLARSWHNCQFRLYDDNDDPDDPWEGPGVDNPEVPHVFAEGEPVLAGLLFGIAYDEFELYGVQDREEALALMRASFVHRLHWGPLGTPDDELVELPLTTAPYIDFVAVFDGVEVPLVGSHVYHVFPELEEGSYVWRAQLDDPLFGPFTARGRVDVVDD